MVASIRPSDAEGQPQPQVMIRILFPVHRSANVTIDWTLRENVRAQLRILVKRILRKYGYPPDKQEKATETVLEQAALLSGEWATV
jgi:Type I restriction enzyme HindI endonuclease subunit-like, C-terminal